MHIGAVGALAHGDRQAGFGIVAEQAGEDFRRRFGAVAVLAVGHGQGLGVFAFGIVRAADEGAELAQLQTHAAICADRALARVAAVFAHGEEMRAEKFVKRVQNFAHAEFLGAVDGLGERFPEIAQHLFPFAPAAGNIVEPFFELGREAVFHVAFKET